MKIKFFSYDDDMLQSPQIRELISFSRVIGFQIVDCAEKVDFVVVIGGDGTMLAAAQKVAHSGTPLLGINHGKIGYLTDVEASLGKESLRRLFAGEHKVEVRMMISAQIAGCEPILALNDLTVHRGQSPRPLRLKIGINSEIINDFRADGVIIATPTGSTAYNLSAGGPLLRPDAEMVAITPICPQSLNGRPIVVASDDVITIVAENATDALIASDGRRIFGDCAAADLEITVKRSSFVTNIVKTHPMGFYEVFREKSKKLI